MGSCSRLSSSCWRAGWQHGATEGLIYAAVATVLAAYIMVVVTIGLQTTGILLMVLGFAAAPMYRGIEFLTGGTVPPTDVFVVGAHRPPGARASCTTG